MIQIQKNPRPKGAGYPLAFERRVVSGGLGTANHEGAGDGLSVEPLIGLAFCFFFAMKKKKRRGQTKHLTTNMHAATQGRAQGNSLRLIFKKIFR